MIGIHKRLKSILRNQEKTGNHTQEPGRDWNSYTGTLKRLEIILNKPGRDWKSYSRTRKRLEFILKNQEETGIHI